MPDHPGAAHYLIHAYDHPPLAERALPAARRYAKIAPDAPHALHMPSHTFTRVGYWQDSIDTNRASADAARKANSAAEVLHALDYQVYAYLQTAQDAAAQRGDGRARGDRGRTVNTAEQYGQVGVLRRGRHPGALRARTRRSGATRRRSRRGRRRSPTSTRSRTSRARSARRAAAMPPRRRRTRRSSPTLRAALVEKKDEYWAQQVDIQQKAAGGVDRVRRAAQGRSAAVAPGGGADGRRDRQVRHLARVRSRRRARCSARCCSS